MTVKRQSTSSGKPRPSTIIFRILLALGGVGIGLTALPLLFSNSSPPLSAKELAERGCTHMGNELIKSVAGRSGNAKVTRSDQDERGYIIIVNLGVVRGERLAQECIADIQTGKIMHVEPGYW